MPQVDPITVTAQQCDERGREVFYRALGKARDMIAGNADFDAAKLRALAAIAEACGVEFTPAPEEETN